MDDETTEKYLNELAEILPPPLKGMDLTDALEVLRNQETILTQIIDVAGPYKAYLTTLVASCVMAHNAGMPAEVHLAVTGDIQKFVELLDKLNGGYEMAPCSEEIH